MILNDNIEQFLNLDARKKKSFKKLGVKTVEDLLRHFPSRYTEARQINGEGEEEKFKKGDTVSLTGVILDIKAKKPNFYAGKKMSVIEADFGYGGGALKAVWFNQPYIAKILSKGDKLALTGKIYENKKGAYLSNPKFEHRENYFQSGVNETPKKESKEEAALIPVYPETRGITSKWFHLSITKVLKSLKKNETRDFIPDGILKKYHLPDLYNGFIYIHLPKSLKYSEAARKRFAFEEIFLIQLERQKQRISRGTGHFFKINIDYGALKNFISSFGFELTNAQKKAVFRICEDFKKGAPMARLLEGDVGSGKTMVALAACFVAAQNGLQAAYMAPTEILARQHFETFCGFFRKAGTKANIGLLTSSVKEKFPSKIGFKKSAKISKNKFLKWLADGEINILIGTHSLIQDKIKFKKLAFVVIDEQHRFGVNQRLKLVSKSGAAPHLLSMTATPIPRTLALTIYGDLDITLLDEMPPGRKDPATYIVPPNEKHRAYEHIREEVKNGRQAYIVCPRIEAREAEGVNGDTGEAEGNELSAEMKAVKKEYKILSETVFKDFNLGILHGKMLPKEKEKILSGFRDKKIDILITTSIIEVGIDIPNVNCVLIEGADRFGLAQLHQLRGRTLRSSHKAHCFAASEKNSIKVLKRLSALTKAKNGFELAEYDLKFRGPGELVGRKQWGISDIGMEALKNIKMVEAAREEAREILKRGSELKEFPLLKEKLKNLKNTAHLE